MPSKFDSIIEQMKLKRIFNTDASHQMKVEAVKAAMKEEPDFKFQARTLAEQYAAARREMDAINAEKSKCQVRLDAIFQLMANQYEVEGTASLTMANGDVVRLQPKIAVRVVDPEAFRLWCLADADLSQKMQLHPSTAQSLVKQLLEAGDPEPPGTEASYYDSATFTKGA